MGTEAPTRYELEEMFQKAESAEQMAEVCRLETLSLAHGGGMLEAARIAEAQEYYVLAGVICEAAAEYIQS